MAERLKGIGCGILFFGAVGFIAVVFVGGIAALFGSLIEQQVFVVAWLIAAGTSPIVAWFYLREEARSRT